MEKRKRVTEKMKEKEKKGEMEKGSQGDSKVIDSFSFSQ